MIPCIGVVYFFNNDSVAVFETVLDLIVSTAKAVVVLITALVGIGFFSSDPNISENFVLYIAPAAVILLTSYGIIWSFTDAFNMVARTLLTCCLFDVKDNGGGSSPGHLVELLSAAQEDGVLQERASDVEKQI